MIAGTTLEQAGVESTLGKEKNNLKNVEAVEWSSRGPWP